MKKRFSNVSEMVVEMKLPAKVRRKFFELVEADSIQMIKERNEALEECKRLRVELNSTIALLKKAAVWTVGSLPDLAGDLLAKVKHLQKIKKT